MLLGGVLVLLWDERNVKRKEATAKNRMILMDAMNVEGMTVDVIHTILKVWQSGSSRFFSSELWAVGANECGPGIFLF